MINIRRWLNEIYIFTNFDKIHTFNIFIFLFLMIFFKLRTIIAIITIVILIWIFSKIYLIKKKHIYEEELDEYCKLNMNNTKCLVYKKANDNYNKLVNNINKTL